MDLLAVGVDVPRCNDIGENNDMCIPPSGPHPPWLHDLKQFVPLQVAFEEEVKEKSDVIDDYEEQVYPKLISYFFGKEFIWV